MSALTKFGIGTDRPSHPEVAAAELTQVAENTNLQRVDNVAATPQPEQVQHLWVEDEYDSLEAEQQPQWEATGTVESRPAEVNAAGLAPAMDGDRRIVESHSSVLTNAAVRYEATQDALASFRRRTGGKLIHYGIKTALVFGDAVGVTLVGINLGDYPMLAGLMAVSAATAAVTSGLVGAEVRTIRDADRRAAQAEHLTQEQARRWGHLFTGGATMKRITKLVCTVAATSGLLISSAIFAGRAELEGTLVGLMYGGIALAVALASFVESYMHADEIAEVIDGAARSYEAEIARHRRLSGARAWREQLEQATRASSVTREHESRGTAARDRVRSLKWGILRRNPGVAGHGPLAPQAMPVGRTDRRGGDVL